MVDERLGTYFWLSEFLDSDYAIRHGIDNTPGAAELGNIRNHLGPGMGRVRDFLGVPVMITSGYRCPALNKAIGGSQNSQHMHGYAADFIAPQFGMPFAICCRLRESGLVWDMLIQEGRWVHISFTSAPRRQILTAHFGPNGATYTDGLLPKGIA